jgi:hypothetical protein
VIHYHGTPITPRDKLLELAGRHFCVPFSDPRDMDVCHRIGQSVMLDNGAFTFWRQARGTDWPAYYEWVRPWLEFWTTWAVIPDVIDGDEDANDALVAAWPFGDRGAPVWHLHESLERLERLVAWPLLCFGSSAAYSEVGSGPWRRRMAEAMEVVCDSASVPRTRLHMLRGMKLCGGPYPFYSVDSTAVARNHSGNNTRGTLPKDVRRMADSFDGRQPPARWERPLEQLGLSDRGERISA